MIRIFRFLFRLLWRWWLADKVIRWIKAKIHAKTAPSQESHTS